MDLQDEIEKLITRRDGQPLVKVPTPPPSATNKRRKSGFGKKSHKSKGFPTLKGSSKRVAELLRISREKVAQQKNIGASDTYASGRRRRKKKSKRSKKKSFPSEWIMRSARNDPTQTRVPLVRKCVCKKCHLVYDTVPIVGLSGPMECKVLGLCNNCKPLSKGERLARKQTAIEDAELATTMAKLAKERRITPKFPKKRPPKVKVHMRNPFCKSLYTLIHEKVHEDWDGLAVRAKEILSRTFTREDLIGMARGPPRLQPQHSIDYYQKMFQAEAEEEAAEAASAHT